MLLELSSRKSWSWKYCECPRLIGTLETRHLYSVSGISRLLRLKSMEHGHGNTVTWIRIICADCRTREIILCPISVGTYFSNSLDSFGFLESIDITSSCSKLCYVKFFPRMRKCSETGSSVPYLGATVILIFLFLLIYFFNRSAHLATLCFLYFFILYVHLVTFNLSYLRSQVEIKNSTYRA